MSFGIVTNGAAGAADYGWIIISGSATDNI